MKTAKASPHTAKPVDVILLVTRFRDVLAPKPSRSGNATDYVMKLARRDPRVFVKGDDLYINNPGAPVRFTLASRPGDRQRYYPLGIAFVREGARSKSDEERLGFLNFPPEETRADDRSLLILDTYRDRAPAVRYKFSVYIQRGSDGAIGVIDPDIVHTGDQ